MFAHAIQHIYPDDDAQVSNRSVRSPVGDNNVTLDDTALPLGGPGGHNIGVDMDEVLDTLLNESALLNFGDVFGQFQMM